MLTVSAFYDAYNTPAAMHQRPAYLYPPGWQLHVTSGFPIAAGPGRDFNESIPLIEEYLRSSVPPHLLANRCVKRYNIPPEL